MSGIAGWLEPGGVDATALNSAMHAASYRGTPKVLSAHPTIALGTYAREGEPRHTSRRGGSILIMHGRVDAVVRGRHLGWQPPEAPGDNEAPEAIIHRAVEQGGPDALNDFAAEAAIALMPDSGDELLLARDVFGLRPLYVARRGRRFAFASDPGVLMALGLATDQLDPEVIAASLARNEPLDGRTAFRSVRALQPGSWLRVDGDGRYREGRWFDPDRLRGARLDDADAVETVRETITAAVVARSKGRRVAISLSGGRDSAAVAIAASRAGLEATGITHTFDADLPVHEARLAREVCQRFGLAWLPAPVTSSPTRDALEDVPRWSGTPLAYGAFPEGTAMPDSAAEAGMDVVLTGEGGEPFFGSAEVAVLDLARTGHLVSAARAARRFNDEWERSYLRLAKVAGRAIAPRSLLRMREQFRDVPPWVKGKVPRTLIGGPAPRSDQQVLDLALRSPHPAGYDLEERLYQHRGVEPAHPLLDLRVVSVALRLGLRHRAPITGFKPILASAFLGDLDESRVKMSFLPYYDRLASSVQESFPELFAPDSVACRTGLLEPAGLDSIGDDRWRIDSLGVAVLETWLRSSL